MIAVGKILPNLSAPALVKNAEPPPHAPCRVCHTAVERKPHESYWHYERRQTCSRACHLAWAARQRLGEDPDSRRARVMQEHAPCPNCGAPVVPWPNESIAKYALRAACSVECGQRYKIARVAAALDAAKAAAQGAPATTNNAPAMDFSGHNMRFKPQVRRLPAPDPRGSGCGSAGAWLLES